MKTFFKALILLPVAVIVVLLAVANRGPVRLSLDPFSQEAPLYSITLPLFAVLFAAVLLGIVIGGVSAWLVQGKHRRAERLYKREARALRSEVAHRRAGSGAGGLVTVASPGGTRP